MPPNTPGLRELAARVDQCVGPDRDIRVGMEINEEGVRAWVLENDYKEYKERLDEFQAFGGEAKHVQ